MSNIVEIKNLSFNYGKHKIFENLNLTIGKGTFTTIIDQDNNGKSTLAKLISCHLFANDEIKVFGKTINKNDYTNISKRISYIGESCDSFFIIDNVKNNIEFILSNYGLDSNQIEEKINNYMRVLGLKHLLKLDNNQLSSGEKQLLSFFIAISKGAELLVMDNCLSMVDNEKRKKIYVLLKSLNKKGLTIINFVSNSNEILYGTDLVIIKNNNVLLNSKTEDAFEDLSLYETNNISLPFIVELSLKLKYYGKVDKIYTDMKKLVNYLWK